MHPSHKIADVALLLLPWVIECLEYVESAVDIQSGLEKMGHMRYFKDLQFRNQGVLDVFGEHAAEHKLDCESENVEEDVLSADEYVEQPIADDDSLHSLSQSRCCNCVNTGAQLVQHYRHQSPVTRDMSINCIYFPTQWLCVTRNVGCFWAGNRRIKNL